MPSNMSTNNNSSTVNNDERERQIKQAEMIRQYLLVNSVETNPIDVPRRIETSHQQINPEDNSTTLNEAAASFPFDFPELRRELKFAEERVERLRQEIQDLQRQRDERAVRSPPPYAPPSTSHSNIQDSHPASQQPITESVTSPLTIGSDFRELFSSSHVNSSFNNLGRVGPSIDPSNNDRHLKFLLAMNQHKEQLLVHLESLKQSLNSLDRLAVSEPSRNEIQINNIKYDLIQQKTRQIQALKSTCASQTSPFFENRIRQLECDLVKLISEHQNDVRIKLELNEQRTLMLLKIVQTNYDLEMIDQQIQRLLLKNTWNLNDFICPTIGLQPNDLNSASLSELIHGRNVNLNRDGRRTLLRELIDIHPLTKFTSGFYHHAL